MLYNNYKVKFMIEFRHFRESQQSLLSHHSCSRNLSDGSGDVHTSKSLNCRRQGSHKLIDLICCIVAAPDEDNLVCLGEGSGDLRGDRGQGLEHEGHDGRVPVLLVGAGLESHALSLGPTHSLHSPGLGASDQPDLLPVSLGALHHPGPVTLGHSLHLVRLGLGGELDCGSELLLLPLDLLLLNLDLFPSLHHLDLNLLIPDSLLDLCCLEFVCKLGLCFRSVDLLVKVSFLQFECPTVVLYLGVSAVLDVHSRLLTFCLSDASISVGLSNTNLCVSLHSSCL